MYQMAQVCKKAREAFEPIIQSPLFDEIFTAYRTNYADYDRWIEYSYSLFNIISELRDESAMLTDFRGKFNSFLLIHKWEFDGLKYLDEEQYNPTENYDLKEHELNTRTPNITRSKNNSDTLGATSGSTDSSNSPDEQSVTNTEFKTPYNTVNSYETNKGVTSNVVNKEGSSHTSYHNDSVVNSSSGSEHETGNEKVERDLTRHGNVGITTYQQMAIQERNYRSFSLFQYVIDKFVHEFCVFDYARDWNDCIYGDSDSLVD